MPVGLGHLQDAGSRLPRRHRLVRESGQALEAETVCRGAKEGQNGVPWHSSTA